MPRLADPDPPLPPVFTASDALAGGLSRDQIRQRLRSGRWVRVAPGIYLPSHALVGQTGPERERTLHLAHVAVVAPRRPDCVVAFQSAALVLGQSIWSPVPKQVLLLAEPSVWRGTRREARLRKGPSEVEIVEHLGLRVTSPARTWFDVARRGSLADALSVGDAGLRDGTLTVPGLMAVIDAHAREHSVGKARRVLEHLSAVRETPLESASWAYFLEHDIPLPRMQVHFRNASGRVFARVDFYWDAFDLIGEADGLVKYDDPRERGREKRREDELRSHGHRIVRWGAADLFTPQLAERLKSLLTETRAA